MHKIKLDMNLKCKKCKKKNIEMHIAMKFRV